MALKLVETADGSHTIINDDLNESYHSRKGAISESTYVFIEQGLRFMAAGRTQLSILEIGLGTGLNVLLTARETARPGFPATFMTSLEPEPLDKAMAERLNYVSELSSFAPARAVHARIHGGQWDVVQQLLPEFRFLKHCLTLEAFQPSQAYDLIYFDAFAPGKQASVWADANFEKLYGCLKLGGALVTYCAQGAFRRSLTKAGFQVERLPGYGKREMTRASKPALTDA